MVDVRRGSVKESFPFIAAKSALPPINRGKKHQRQRKEYKMKSKIKTLAILGVALMLLPIPNVDEVEWFPPDIGREIAKSAEVKNSENAVQPRDTSLEFRTVRDGVQKIVNDQSYR